MYTQEYLQREEINLSKGIDELKDWAMHNVRLISILPSNKNLPVDTKLTDVLEHDVDEKYYLSDERTEQLMKEFPRDLPDGVDGFNKADGDVSYALTTRTSACYLTQHIEKSKATLISVSGLPIREATKKGYTLAEPGGSVNIQYPESGTRRGRVGKGVANTLEASGVNQGVVTKVYGSTQKNAAITDGD